MSKLKIQLSNGHVTEGCIMDGLIHGTTPIEGYVPMWKIDTGLCDFFFCEEANKEMDNEGLNIVSINGEPL